MSNSDIHHLVQRARTGLERTVRWLSEHISERNYQILVAIIIGIVAGLAAVVLKYSVAKVREWMLGNDPTQGNWGFVFFPVVGILLTVLYVRFVLRKKLEMGFPDLIYRISKKRVSLPRHESWSHIITSSLTVGLGGSVGLEAPIVRTGSAIGSNLAQYLNAGRKYQTLFLTCGAAAGMAAIFNSPVAAVIFAFEVLLTDIALHAFIPLLIAAATGAVVSRFFYYEQLFYLPATGWRLQSVPFYVLFGMLCGLYSVYLVRTTLFFQRFLGKWENKQVQFVLGGLVLGGLIFLLPPLFGEGYGTVNQLLRGNIQEITEHSLFFYFADHIWAILLFALAVILAKAIATSLTMAMGGNGGIFAPAMFSGAVLGFIFATAVNMTGLVELNTEDFIVVGMAGLLSGVIKSPLTGIFLIAEITGGYVLFVPLMLVAALAYFVCYYFEPQSIFTRELYQKGLWVPSHEKDLKILKNMHLSDFLETNFAKVKPTDTLGTLVEAIAHSKRNVFPVVDVQGRLAGILLLDDVRELMFKPEHYDTTLISELMYPPPSVLDLDEAMESVMAKFDRYQVWNLPVLKDGKYQGFVSKSSVFGKYRELLQQAGE